MLTSDERQWFLDGRTETGVGGAWLSLSLLTGSTTSQLSVTVAPWLPVGTYYHHGILLHGRNVRPLKITLAIRADKMFSMYV